MISPTIQTALVSLVSLAAAACTRESLFAAAETYMAAQTTGKLDDLQKLSAVTPVDYRQNNKKVDVAASLLSKPLKLDHNRTIADTTRCASFTELVATGGPYVIGTQLQHDPETGQITLIDTIAATTGDWAFNAAKTLSYIAPEDWSPLPEDQRSSRETLQAAGDAYLDMWSNSTAINAVPWGTPCARTEGSAHVTPSCRSGAPSGGSASGRVTNRRYVIDEVIGSCNILCAFAGGLPDSHEFRLVSGKLRLVHTITV